MTPERWLRVKQVFQGAMEQPVAEREAYVDAESAGDGELRHEVGKMLRYATGAGLLDVPAWEGMTDEARLSDGSRLGPYEVLAAVGSGGMGTVYKARDTRLERTVAIKVLGAEFSHRVRTEGRAISALNHPHVCALYDIGEQEGAAYLVMEYVEGESLGAVLARGSLRLDSTLRYGAEIAAALAAAHERGIVHRDLKPANIMITASGAKVLDFGVARMGHDEEPGAGGLVGTAAYMSPSRLNGNPADARSDIYALGLVLFEMSTGQRHSRGSTKMPKSMPGGLARVIERCLAEDAAGRFQRMDEVQRALERLRTKALRPQLRRWYVPVTLAATLAIGTLLLWRPAAKTAREAPSARTEVPVARPSAAPPPAAPSVSHPVSTPTVVHRAVFEPPALTTLASYRGIERDPSFSPDGTQVAFSWQSGVRGGYNIYVRSVTPGDTPVQLTDESAEDWGPAWSPFGRRIAFRRRSQDSGIYWVSVLGGPAHFVAAIGRQNQETLPQMSWSRDAKWIAGPDREGGGATHLYLFGVDSGERRQITFNGSGTDHAPAFSPDGKSLAYASCMAGVGRCDLFVVPVSGGQVSGAPRRITNEAMYVRGTAWLPNGRSLVYSAGSTIGRDTYLWRVSVDPPGIPERIDLAGRQARHPAIGRDGSLLAFTTIGNWRLMMIRNFR